VHSHRHRQQQKNKKKKPENKPEQQIKPAKNQPKPTKS